MQPTRSSPSNQTSNLKPGAPAEADAWKLEDHWQELVSLLERAYPHSRITLFAHEKGQPLQRLSVSKNFNADDLNAYADHHIKTSPYVPLGYEIPVGVPTKSESMVSDRELKKTEHYNEYVRPRGLGHYATGMVIERGLNRMVALSMADQKDGSVSVLGSELVKQKKLTAYQAGVLAQGQVKGLVFGEYTVLDKIGEGGMGLVFKAQHRHLKRLVALKVLHPAVTQTEEAVKRFHREVEAMARLNHPNIVAAFDNVGGAWKSIKNGQVRALAVTDVERSKFLPDVPTTVELGYPTLISSSARGIVAPKGTPPAVAKRIADAFETAMRDPEHIKKLDEQGLATKILVGEEHIRFYREAHEKARKYVEWAKKRPQK